MSVTKCGHRRPRTAALEQRHPAQGHLPARRGRHHRRRGRGQRRRERLPPVPAAYNEVITVSALADTDGKPGGLGGNRCYSWGGYDTDDTFADFSNYGARRRHHRARQVHLVDDARAGYDYSSGTSHGGARSHRRRRAVQGQPAAGRPRPRSRRRSSTSATSAGRPRPIPTAPTRSCSTSARSARSARSASPRSPSATVGEAGGPVASRSRSTRSATFFERVRLSVDGSRPAGPPAHRSSLYRLRRATARRSGSRSRRTPAGHVPRHGSADEHWGRVQTDDRDVEVASDLPTAQAADRSRSWQDQTSGPSSGPTVRSSWPAATDPIERDRRLRAPAQRRTAGRGSAVTTTAATVRTRADASLRPSSRRLPFRIRAQRQRRQLEPVGRHGPVSRPRSSTIAAVGDVHRGAGRSRARRRPSGGSTRYSSTKLQRQDRLHVHAAAGSRSSRRLGPVRGKGRDLHRWRLPRHGRPAPRRAPSIAGSSCTRDLRQQRDAHDRRSRSSRAAGSTLDAFVVLRRRRSASCNARDMRRRRTALACARHLCAIVTLAAASGRVPVREGRSRRGPDRGASDVEGGHPVRAGHHPGQALSGDRVQGHQLQHAPQERTCRGSR